MDMENLEVEIGFPISADLPGRGDTIRGSIPGGLYVCSAYTGPCKCRVNTVKWPSG
ncbi:hypothetical protein PHOSAC3_150087 [Mesotoga infera]|nr:hypothetical protein PHOSAC3_150087 [Mesotoga infera]